jgi:spore coat polysaccharide biosynthesis protein SpsF
MKIVAITQARYSSSRLPGKVLKKINDQTVLGLHLMRIKKSKHINKVIVATTNETEANSIKDIAVKNACDFFQGSSDDVLDRFYQAVKNEKADYIVRLTSDCPLIDPVLIDDLIEKFLAMKVDYASNCLNPTLPDGMDAEIFTFNSLEDAWRNARLSSEREHVTPFIRNCGKFKIYSHEYEKNLSKYRMTLDTIEDLEVISSLVRSCGELAGLNTYVDFLIKNPDIMRINSKHERNEGYQKSIKGDSVC